VCLGKQGESEGEKALFFLFANFSKIPKIDSSIIYFTLVEVLKILLPSGFP
jgi:hypothetical protein